MTPMAPLVNDVGARGAVSDRRSDVIAGFAGLALGLAVLGPGLGPGSLLNLDLVATTDLSASGCRGDQCCRVRWASIPRKPPMAMNSVSRGRAEATKGPRPSAQTTWSCRCDALPSSSRASVRALRCVATAPRASVAIAAVSWSVGSSTAARSN